MLQVARVDGMTSWPRWEKYFHVASATLESACSLKFQASLTQSPSAEASSGLVLLFLFLRYSFALIWSMAYIFFLWRCIFRPRRTRKTWGINIRLAHLLVPFDSLEFPPPKYFSLFLHCFCTQYLILAFSLSFWIFPRLQRNWTASHWSLAAKQGKRARPWSSASSHWASLWSDVQQGQWIQDKSNVPLLKGSCSMVHQSNS